MTPMWRKASRSSTEGGACVEVARLSADTVGIRDSRDATVPPHPAPAAVRRLVDAVRVSEDDTL
ncbi:DUF397 domain-containing protein [Spirillospora sp. NPDC052269]